MQVAREVNSWSIAPQKGLKQHRINGVTTVEAV
jgi:hypothetical protein